MTQVPFMAKIASKSSTHLSRDRCYCIFICMLLYRLKYTNRRIIDKKYRDRTWPGGRLTIILADRTDLWADHPIGFRMLLLVEPLLVATQELQHTPSDRKISP